MQDQAENRQSINEDVAMRLNSEKMKADLANIADRFKTVLSGYKEREQKLLER